MICFTAEEIWKYMPHTKNEQVESVMLSDWPEVVAEYDNEELEQKWNHILELKESEKIAYAFYKIMENILFNNDILLKYYNLYYHRKINKKKIVNEIVKLYENKNDTIKISSMKNRIKLLKNNKVYEESWNNYRMRENVFIEYDDIIYFIHLRTSP